MTLKSSEKNILRKYRSYFLEIEQIMDQICASNVKHIGYFYSRVISEQHWIKVDAPASYYLLELSDAIKTPKQTRAYNNMIENIYSTDKIKYTNFLI